MKRGFKSLLMILGVFWILSAPQNVWAAEYKLGKAEKSENITKIPVTIHIGDNESITQAKLTCDAKNSDVDCRIEIIEGLGFTANESANGIVLSYINSSDPSDNNFPKGDTVVANVILTNNSTSALSNVRVDLEGSTIGDVAQSDYTDASLGAKPVEKPKSGDATLKSLKVSQGKMSPEFKNDVYDYTIYDIADTINSVKITYECNAPADEGECSDSGFHGGKSTNGSTVTLNQGENKVYFEITSPDGNNHVTYNLTIYRGESTFNSDKLSSLSVGDYTLTPAFSADVVSYNLTVPNTISSIKDLIAYTLQDEKAKVDVQGAENLIVGLNRVTLKVDNVNGDSSKTYVINVTRLSEENIEIVSYKNNIVTYKDENGIESKIEMTEFEKQYPTEAAKIKNGIYKFDEEGNLIVENTNPTVTEEPEADEEKKDNKVWLIVVLVIVGLAIIIVSGILIFRKKDKKEELSDAKEENIEKHEDKAPAEEEDENYSEDGIEEAVIGGEFSDDLDTTVDVDIALNDLMNTKQYEFDDDQE